MLVTAELEPLVCASKSPNEATERAAINGASIVRGVFSDSQVAYLLDIRGADIKCFDPEVLGILNDYNEASQELKGYGYNDYYYADIPLGKGRGWHKDTSKFRGFSLIAGLAHEGVISIAHSPLAEDQYTNSYGPGDVLILRNHGVIHDGAVLPPVVHSADSKFRAEDANFPERAALMLNRFDGKLPIFK